MLQSFHRSVFCQLQDRKVMPQLRYRLMVIAVDYGSAAQQLPHPSGGLRRVNDIAGGGLMAGDVTVESPAEKNIERLHTAADSQNRTTALCERLYQEMFSGVKVVIDITTAG